MVEQKCQDTDERSTRPRLSISLSYTDPVIANASYNETIETVVQGNLRHPRGIAIAHLNEIFIQFKFSLRQAEESRKRPKLSHRDEGLPISESDLLFSEDSWIANPWPLSQPNPRLHHRYDTLPRQVHSQPSLATAPEDQDDEDLFVELDSTSDSVISNERVSHPASTILRNLSDRTRSKRNYQANVDSSSDLKIQASLQLIEVAFRTILGDDRARIIPGVKLIGDHSSHDLADTSPSLFSPGYRQVLLHFIQSQALYLTMSRQ